jgi:outer membrane protein OmpA-like peptidoglycan-associated protein
MKTRAIILFAATLLVGACSTENYRYNNDNSGPRYIPRAEVSQSNYTNANRMEDYSDRTMFKRYEHREPCQNYRNLPRNMIDSCVVAEEEVVMVNKQKPSDVKDLKIVRSYTILFDHDSADLRNNEVEVINQALSEIKKYSPYQVTVTGYTDTSGPADYNQTLSRQREQTVSRALLNRGIQNKTLERAARGEYDQAVNTSDGVRNQENRRVTIDFHR